jgi:hypothetical protein
VAYQPTSFRLSSLRISAQSAQIIREIEWNLRDESRGLDAGKTISYPILFEVFILQITQKSKI